MSYFLPGYPSSHSYGASAQTPSSGIRRFDYAAVYFAKRKLSLGIWWDSLDPATRQRLPPDSGLRAGVVVAGSPAARAGILAGDIILSVDGVPVNSHETIAPQLAAHMGEIIVVEVDRDGQRMEMKVALNTE